MECCLGRYFNIGLNNSFKLEKKSDYNIIISYKQNQIHLILLINRIPNSKNHNVAMTLSKKRLKFLFKCFCK